MAKTRLWTYLAAGAVLAIALSSAALGANSNANANATAAALPDQASQVASAVLGALTGGSNPSTVASNDAATADKADKAKAKAETAADTDAADVADKEVSEGQASKPASTTGIKPGFGCGDDNHTHSGPPGRPGATPPPGCAKAKH